MESKLIEIRDRATKLYMIATRMSSSDVVESKILSDSGYPSPNLTSVIENKDYDKPLVLLGRIEESTESHYDPFKWNSDTIYVAHEFIKDNWNSVFNCWTVDVEAILNMSSGYKVPDRYYYSDSIRFKIKDYIELSDFNSVIDILDKEYNLIVLSSENDILVIKKSSVINCGLKFLEVLRDYLEIIE